MAIIATGDYGDIALGFPQLIEDYVLTERSLLPPRQFWTVPSCYDGMDRGREDS